MMSEMMSETIFMAYHVQRQNVTFSRRNNQIKPNVLHQHDCILHPGWPDTLKLKWDRYFSVQQPGCPMGHTTGQVKVPLKMGFFSFFLADLAIFLFLTLPSCLLSCSKQVLSIDSQKKIIKTEHDRENHPNYARHPDLGIHLQSHSWWKIIQISFYARSGPKCSMRLEMMHV